MSENEEWVTLVQTALTDEEQQDLVDSWNGMPEFVNEKDGPIQKIILSFKTLEDVQQFSKLIDQKITDKTKSIWYPVKFKSNDISKWF